MLWPSPNHGTLRLPNDDDDDDDDDDDTNVKQRCWKKEPLHNFKILDVRPTVIT